MCPQVVNPAPARTAAPPKAGAEELLHRDPLTEIIARHILSDEAGAGAAIEKLLLNSSPADLDKIAIGFMVFCSSSAYHFHAEAKERGWTSLNSALESRFEPEEAKELCLLANRSSPERAVRLLKGDGAHDRGASLSERALAVLEEVRPGERPYALQLYADGKGYANSLLAEILAIEGEERAVECAELAYGAAAADAQKLHREKGAVDRSKLFLEFGEQRGIEVCKAYAALYGRHLTDLRLTELTDAANHMLRHGDIDGDGLLSVLELGDFAALRSPARAMSSAAVVLLRTINDMQSLHKDGWFTENGGITKGDIAAARGIIEKYVRTPGELTGRESRLIMHLSSAVCDVNRELREGIEPLERVSGRAHAVMDFDGNGSITMPELNRAVSHPAVRGRMAQAAAALRTHFKECQEAFNDEWGEENDGITAADIRAAAKDPQLSKQLKTVQRNAEQSITLCRAETLFGTEGKPTLSGVQQWSIGNCYALAALGAFAVQRPAELARLISSQENGSFTVSLPGAKVQRLYVTAPTDGEIALYGPENERGGFWSGLFLKAIGSLRLGGDTSLPDYERTDTGGYSSTIVEMLTGHCCRRMPTKGDNAEEALHTALTAAMKDKRIVCASTRDKAEELRAKGYSENHAYSVVDYDSANRIIHLHNPQQYSPSNSLSVVKGLGKKISLAEAAAVFHSFDVETDQVLDSPVVSAGDYSPQQAK